MYFVMIAVLGSCRSYGTTVCCKQGFPRSSLWELIYNVIFPDLQNHVVQCYPRAIEYYESRILHWAGDAKKYVSSSKESYIEIVTSPNNPCGAPRQEAVGDNGLGSNAAGFLVHDLAYYWPTFTPISAAADHDIMLFTLSKCTGHGGSRIG